MDWLLNRSSPKQHYPRVVDPGSDGEAVAMELPVNVFPVAPSGEPTNRRRDSRNSRLTASHMPIASESKISSASNARRPNRALSSRDGFKTDS